MNLGLEVWDGSLLCNVSPWHFKRVRSDQSWRRKKGHRPLEANQKCGRDNTNVPIRTARLTTLSHVSRSFVRCKCPGHWSVSTDDDYYDGSALTASLFIFIFGLGTFGGHPSSILGFILDSKPRASSKAYSEPLRLRTGRLITFSARNPYLRRHGYCLK